MPRTAVSELGRGDFAVPVSAGWDGGVLMNQFPLAISLLEAIGFAHHEAFRIARLQHHVHSLNRAHEAHVAVHDDVRFKDIDLARLEAAEHPVKKLQCRLNTPRGKSWNVEP